MCGICGLVDFSGSPVGEDVLTRMVATLHHRGPDDRGVFVDGFAGLGHTRLSIIDLSSAGHQPMHSACGRYVLSFNGEIYNFQELRRRLEGQGATFRGHSDSEVLLEAFIAWGVDAFPQLEGMFAFALLDHRERKLFLVRDPFGIKPLYYARLPHGLVFGSEVKALLASGRLDRKLDGAPFTSTSTTATPWAKARSSMASRNYYPATT